MFFSSLNCSRLKFGTKRNLKFWRNPVLVNDDLSSKFVIALHPECDFPYEFTKPISCYQNTTVSMTDAEHHEKMRYVTKKDLSKSFSVDKKQWIPNKRDFRRTRKLIFERKGV
ncbi:MAG: hypothetical protein MHMPM18_000598 [Marteilia pararefringens]